MKIVIELDSANLADDAARLVALFGPLLVGEKPAPRRVKPESVEDAALPRSSNSVDGPAVLDAALSGDTAAAVTIATNPTAEPKRGRGRPRKVVEAEPEPAPAPATVEPKQPPSADIFAPAPAPAADPVEVQTATEEDARKALDSLFKAKGMDVALSALQRVGAKRFPDVLPETYAKLVAVCAELS